MSRVQQVAEPGSDVFGWTVVDETYAPIEPIDRFLRWLTSTEKSPNTTYTYAHGLSIWWDYLAARGVEWDSTGLLETLAQWAAWLQRRSGNVVVLRGKPVRSKATVNIYLSAVYGLYRYHKRLGLDVLDNLITSVDGRPKSYKSFLHGLATGPQERRLVKAQPPKRIVTSLTLEQALTVIAALNRLRDKFLFALLLVTGMRIGQALGLRHEDFVSPRRLVRIVARSDNANGARAKGAPGTVLGESPITSELVRLYSDYLHEEYGDLDSDYLFVNLWGGEYGSPMTYGSVNDIVQRTRQKVGFHFTAHQFRHTFATISREAGISMDVLSKLLTHSSVATTSDIYCHLDATFIRKELVAAGVIEETLGKVLS